MDLDIYSNISQMAQRSNMKSSFEKAYNEEQCEQFIKDALDYMENDGYDFKYSSLRDFVGKTKLMIRNKIYLRFNCSRCQNGKKKKRFTSTMGTIQIQFQLQRLQQERRDPWALVFKFQIYRMRCSKCGIYGEAQIYDSQLEKIQNKFCEIVANILNKVPPKKKERNKNPIIVPELIDHRHSDCQACAAKLCHPGPCVR